MTERPDWWPPCPYPLAMTHINDTPTYVAAVPDPKIRTGVSWFLYGEGWRVAERQFEDALKNRHEEHNEDWREFIDYCITHYGDDLEALKHNLVHGLAEST